MMRYRAVFKDPENLPAAKPNTIPAAVQIVGNDWPTIEKWANEKLAAATGPDSYVQIYETAETLIESRKKPKVPNGTAA